MHLFDSKCNFRDYFWAILIFYTFMFQIILIELHSKILFFTLKSPFRRKRPLNYIK